MLFFFDLMHRLALLSDFLIYRAAQSFPMRRVFEESARSPFLHIYVAGAPELWPRVRPKLICIQTRLLTYTQRNG